MAPQSYYLGGKIRASDYNGFVDDINEIVGLGAGDSGYGQNQLMVSYVATGQKVTAANWDELLTSIKFAAQHQGTNIFIPTSTTDPNFPKIRNIIAIIPDLISDISNVRANKLNYDISKMSLDANKISSSKVYTDPAVAGPTEFTWTETVSYEFNVSFADNDAMRNFFNSGGEVRVSGELTGYDNSHVQSVSWATLLSSISTVKISHNTTESANFVGTPGVGFTGLTNIYERVYRKGGTAGYYSGNQLNVYAKLNGTNSIDVKVEFYDAYPTNSDGTVNNFIGNDYVAGTLTVTVDQQRADDNDVSGNGVVSPSPTYSHISEL